MRIRTSRLIFGALFILVVLFISLRVIHFNNAKRSYKNYNIILISVDTLRADHIGAYGYPKKTTPSLDNFIKSAQLFTNARTIYPLTYESFYTLFTGTEDVFGQQLTDRKTTFPKYNSKNLTEILKANGFTTVAFVTNPVLGELSSPFFKKGFNSFTFVGNKARAEEFQKVVREKDKVNNPEKFSSILVKNYMFDFFYSKKTAEKATDWLKKNTDKKFFLWVHFTNPHFPYNPSRQDMCQLDGKFCDQKTYENLFYSKKIRNSGCEKNLTRDDINKMQNLYDGEIASVDEQVGNILKTISSLRLTDKTIIIFYSDHGEGFDHDIYGHGQSLYDSAVRIGLAIKYPNVSPKYITQSIDNTDILPSILDSLGISYQSHELIGKSFYPLINGAAQYIPKKYFFSMTPVDESNKFSILSGNYKYVISRKNECLYNNNSEELYDLKNDSVEQKNLVISKKDIVEKLRSTLKEKFGINQLDRFSLEKNTNALKSLGY